MKRSLALLLTSLMLVFALTACGGNDKQQDNTANQNGSAVTGSDNTTDQGSNTNGSNDNGNRDDRGDSLAGDVGDAITDGVDDVEDGIDDVGDALTGENAANGTTNGTANRTRGVTGTTYEQMLRNARVHDRDGDLLNGGNSTTANSVF